MNYKQKIEANRHLKALFKPSSMEGASKWSNTGISHYMAICGLLAWFKKQSYLCWTECTFNKPYTGRADLIAIRDQHGYIIEVTDSETDKRYEEKVSNYPEEFFLIKVKAKEFNYDTFTI